MQTAPQSLAKRFINACGLLALLCSCAGEPAKRPAAGVPPRVVQVAQADRTQRSVTTDVVGTVRAVRSATIAPLISGTVVEVRVGLGSSVRAGEVLLRLSAREIDARLEQTRAVSALAKRDRDRAIALKDTGAISVAQYETAITQWNVAQARQAEAGTLADRTVLRAPFAGVVTAKLANVGDTAMPGQALLVLESPGALRFEARVPETAVDALAVGRPLPVRLDGLDHDIEGRIAEIQPASDDATRTRLAKIDLPATPGVRSGRFGRVLLTTGGSVGVAVPAEAVVRHGQLEGVFVVTSGTARLRLVRTGRERDGRVEIVSGLAGDEKVVLAGAADLVDGQRVEEAR
ncbi:MAG TPA: efflux RND transporter periplasmic adaptor subunit [Myxococcaceae bacterium]|nr:efflux RND transporter periplasmic adaptor subunit [Myxococcaceae bacterium]